METGENKSSEIAEFLGDVDLFRHLKADALESLAPRIGLVYLPEGPIVKESDPVDGLYIIKSGMVKVTKSAERWEAEAVLAILRPGKCFGEIGLIDGLSRSANVTAMEPTQCYFLPRDAFLQALEENPEIGSGMLPALAAMVRSADRWVAQLL
jgi:CRP-like cAMP-binding protein